MLAEIEAKIDFPDEDLPNDILNEIKKSSDDVLKSLEKFKENSKNSNLEV